jgi:hypothetical protein
VDDEAPMRWAGVWPGGAEDLEMIIIEEGNRK